MSIFFKSLKRSAADAHRWRIGGTKLGVLLLDIRKLTEHHIILVVRNLGCIILVIES